MSYAIRGRLSCVGRVVPLAGGPSSSVTGLPGPVAHRMCASCLFSLAPVVSASPLVRAKPVARLPSLPRVLSSLPGQPRPSAGVSRALAAGATPVCLVSVPFVPVLRPRAHRVGTFRLSNIEPVAVYPAPLWGVNGDQPLFSLFFLVVTISIT